MGSAFDWPAERIAIPAGRNASRGSGCDTGPGSAWRAVRGDSPRVA
jgi:hypothetical protein